MFQSSWTLFELHRSNNTQWRIFRLGYVLRSTAHGLSMLKQQDDCASWALFVHNGRACAHKRINQSKRTSCNKQKTNASNHTKKTIRVHVAAATATATSTVKATATAAATARATEQRKKKWVNRYKAISSSVVFLLWSRASYATDVRYFCVNIHRGNYHYYFFECNLIESVIHVNFAEKKTS